MPLFPTLDRLRADLDALRPLAPEQETRVLQKFRLEWNYNSNAIEGNSLTLGETRSLLLHGVAASGKSIRDHDDIRNHNKVVAEVELLSTEARPVTEHLIREMHEILLGREPYYVEARTADGAPTRQLIQPGTYKRNPNQALTATGERIFFASPEETPGRMTDLVDWYRAEEAAPTMHPVALAAEFHYRFVRIHPFDDGNGRMSRLLMNLILLRHGYPMTVIQAADRNRYLAALSAADAGEPEPFLRFIIENVEAGLRLMIQAARGESIDEPSDLDKKWAILQRQVLTRELPQNHNWNLTTQRELYDNLIGFWLANLASLVKKADDLFAISGILFACLGPQSPSSNHVMHTIDNALDSARLCFLGAHHTLEESMFIFRWNGFKQFNNEYKLRLLVEFKFYHTEFIVKYRLGEPPLEDNSVSWPTVFTSDYKLEYDHAQIHEINYQLANKVYDFIAAKLAEADTPPA